MKRAAGLDLDETALLAWMGLQSNKVASKRRQGGEVRCCLRGRLLGS